MIFTTERIENLSQKSSGLNFMKILSHVGLLNAYRQTDKQADRRNDYNRLLRNM